MSPRVHDRENPAHKTHGNNALYSHAYTKRQIHSDRLTSNSPTDEHANTHSATTTPPTPHHDQRDVKWPPLPRSHSFFIRLPPSLSLRSPVLLLFLDLPPFSFLPINFYTYSMEASTSASQACVPTVSRRVGVYMYLYAVWTTNEGGVFSYPIAPLLLEECSRK